MEEITLDKIDLLRARTGITYAEAKGVLEKNEGNVIESLIDLEENKKACWTDEITAKSSEVVEKVKQLFHEGNVRKIIVKSDGKALLEIPVAIGALSALILPQITAVSVLLAVWKNCSIDVVRDNGKTETFNTGKEE